MIMLDERLSTVASLVRKGSYFCDVGTDHGYLPCYLVQQGIVSRCIACDINILPLQSAQKQVISQQLEASIEVILSDGLNEITPEVEDIAIAGMGGELIAQIIMESDFLRDSNKRLILQPMTNAPHLRRELYRGGFEIITEISVVDGRHMYCVMQVAYNGIKQEISKLFSVLGKIPDGNGQSAIAYVEWVLDSVSKIISGLRKSSNEEFSITDYLELAKEIEDIKERIMQDEIC